MSILSNLFDLFRAPRRVAERAVLPLDKTRVQFLSGEFSSLRAAKRYCYYALGDAPEQITFEQEDAFIDTAFVEVVYEAAAARLSEFLTAADVDQIEAEMAGDNTLIILSEEAFGGFPYSLSDTPTVRYLGERVVDI